jgi:bacteriorhodopsin
MNSLNIFQRGNDVMDINPPAKNVNLHITTHGSDWLWAVCAVFGFHTIVLGGLFLFTSSKKAPFKRAIMLIPLFLNIIFVFSYFTYASNLGNAGVPTEFFHVTTSDSDTNTRQVFYSKFIAWFLGWPLVMALYEINLTSIYDKEHIASSNSTHDESNIALDNSQVVSSRDLLQKVIVFIQGFLSKSLMADIWVLGLLVGSVVQSIYKWGYFVFAVCFQLIGIILVCRSTAYSMATHSSNKLTRVGHLLIIFQIIPWILQTVNWGLSEGGNVIQPDSEAVWAGILDLIIFGWCPAIVTFINIESIDEDFFHKLGYSNFNLGLGREKLEKITETARHSGDTAVPRVVSNEPIDE